MAETKKDTEWMQFETGHGKKPNQKLNVDLIAPSSATYYPHKSPYFNCNNTLLVLQIDI